MSIAIFFRFIYIMYGMRYLSIVDSRFVKIAITLAWFIPLILTISSYVGFQDTVSNYFIMQYKIYLFLVTQSLEKTTYIDLICGEFSIQKVIRNRYVG